MTEASTTHQPKIGTAVYTLFAAASLALVVYLGLREDWQPDLLAGLVVLSAAMAPLAIERKTWSTNGIPLAVVIAACALGPAQAACVGLAGALADNIWYLLSDEENRLRTRPTLNNVVTYSLFPIAASAVGYHVDLSHAAAHFVGIVTLAYFAGFAVNVPLMAVCDWSEDGVKLSDGLKLDATILAEFVAAEFSAAGVYVVLTYGLVGLVAAGANLILFMALIGRLFKAIDDEKTATAKSEEAEEQRRFAERHRDEAERLRALAEDRLVQIAYGYRLQVAGTMEGLQAKDRSTGRHSAVVSALMRAFSAHLGGDAEEVEFATEFGLVHDIGKLEIPERPLTKPGRLTQWEMLLFREHPEDGAYFVRNLKDGVKMARFIVSHHERWDGGDPKNFWKMGYPHGLKGEEIPKLSRMLAIVDTYEAITNRNYAGHYRTHDEALEVLREEKGRQFQPELVDAFIDMIESRPDLRFNRDRGETFKAELERFLGDRPPGYGE